MNKPTYRCPCCDQPAIDAGSWGMHISEKRKAGYVYLLCNGCTERNKSLSYVKRRLRHKKTIRRLLDSPSTYDCSPQPLDLSPVNYLLSTPQLVEIWLRFKSPEAALSQAFGNLGMTCDKEKGLKWA